MLELRVIVNIDFSPPPPLQQAARRRVPGHLFNGHIVYFAGSQHRYGRGGQHLARYRQISHAMIAGPADQVHPLGIAGVGDQHNLLALAVVGNGNGRMGIVGP